MTLSIVYFDACIQLGTLFYPLPFLAQYPFWPELVHPASWAAEAADVCEGINHPDAPVVDTVEAARMLAVAAEYTATFDEAGLKRSAGRQRR